MIQFLYIRYKFKIMQLLFLPLILGILPAYIANTKGKNFFIWWIYGFCLFIIALPHSILLTNVGRGLRKCPQCAELIKNEALICRFCGFGKTEIAPSSEKNPFIEWKKKNPNGTLNDFYKLNTKL